MSQAQQLFEQGVAAVKAKQLAQGRQLLKESLALDAENDRAWLWYSKTLDDPEKQLKCVERALKINPDSAPAQELQRRLLEKTGQTSQFTSKAEKAIGAKEKSVSSDMGKLLGVVGIRGSEQFQRIAGIIIYGLIGIGIVYAGFQGLVTSLGIIPVVGFAFMPFLMVVFLIWRYFEAHGKEIRLYEQGIVHIQQNEQKSLTWAELEGITYQDYVIKQYYSGIPIGKYVIFAFDLYQNGKKQVSITKDFHEYREVAAIIAGLIHDMMLSKYVDKVKRGYDAVFGKIIINQQGIHKGKKSLLWHDLQSVRFEVSSNYGIIWMETHNGRKFAFRFIRVDKVLNCYILEDLLTTLHAQYR